MISAVSLRLVGAVAGASVPRGMTSGPRPRRLTPHLPRSRADPTGCLNLRFDNRKTPMRLSDSLRVAQDSAVIDNLKALVGTRSVFPIYVE